MPRTPSMDRQAAEDILGPAAEFIITSQNRSVARKWACAIGIPSTQVYAMTQAQLANLYHEQGPKAMTAPQQPKATHNAAPSAVTADKADAVAKLLQAIEALTTGKVVDDETVRQIAREEAELARDRMLGDMDAALKDRAAVQRVDVYTAGALTGTIAGRTHYQVPTVLRSASIGDDIMLVGPAGCGKTHIGTNVAEGLNMPYYITSCVNEPHELLGFVDGYGNYKRTPFREAFENGGIWIADEIDAWDAAALLAANSALANGFAAFPDQAQPVKRHENFRVIATANTFGRGADRVYVGRNELDAASLDRFAFIEVDYDPDLETLFCNGNIEWLHRVWKIRKAVTDRRIRHVVSSRAIIKGARGLAAGFTQHEAEEMYVFKGMSKGDREKVADA